MTENELEKVVGEKFEDLSISDFNWRIIFIKCKIKTFSTKNKYCKDI